MLVSDRHDNIGMDAVARAVADRAGATAVLDAGDDTSTGRPWEAFSLDSLVAAFDDDTYDERRWAVAGNHDNGTFVSGHLADHGWTVLDGEVVEGPGGGPMLGVADPRSSGLGNWRDETGLTFEEVADRLADAACEADEDGERISTLLVHDANLGDPTLERGCADLVLAGHLHVRRGPTAVLGDNGEVGYSFTTGTTGGAAYAIALGSKPRRDADISLVTYRDGRPVGLQSVLLQTDGEFVVGDYVTLDEISAEDPGSGRCLVTSGYSGVAPGACNSRHLSREPSLSQAELVRVLVPHSSRTRRFISGGSRAPCTHEGQHARLGGHGRDARRDAGGLRVQPRP